MLSNVSELFQLEKVCRGCTDLTIYMIGCPPYQKPQMVVPYVQKKKHGVHVHRGCAVLLVVIFADGVNLCADICSNSYAVNEQTFVYSRFDRVTAQNRNLKDATIVGTFTHSSSVMSVIGLSLYLTTKRLAFHNNDLFNPETLEAFPKPNSTFFFTNNMYMK